MTGAGAAVGGEPRSREEVLAAIGADVRRELAAGRVEVGEASARLLLGPLVPFGATIPCRTVDEAVAAAAEIGHPVVVKALLDDVLHKSEHGLVVTGCDDDAAVRAAGELLLERAAVAGSGEPELSVQAQLAGVELAVGARQTELGPVVLVAAGGTLIELLDDSAIAMAPVTRERAAELVGSLCAATLLDGYRGAAAADREGLVDLVVAVGELVAAIPEIAELDLNPVFVGPDGPFAADARCVLAEPAVDDAAVPGEATRVAVRSLLEPRRVAVVGASRDERKVGGLVLRYLRKHGWKGEIVAVNPKPLDLDGVTSAPTVAAIEEPVDLACIAVPGPYVEGVIGECVAAGVPAGIVYASGFGEAGADGAAAERALVAAGGDGFRFVGPNSIGVATPGEGLVATFGMAFERDEIPAGPVAFVSQSGAIATSLISRADEFGLGFSHWISTGNEADLGVADYVDFLADDPATEVICLFLEVVRRPAAFAAACERARAAGKPIVAVKTGRSEVGRAAAASHTGAITGSDVTYGAFLERCGVVRVPDLGTLFGAARGLLSIGPVAGRRVGVISMSGGACSMLADAASDAGLEVPVLPDEAQAELRAGLPEFAAVRNPVDVTAVGIGAPELVHRTLTAVRRSGAVDVVLLQLSTNADPAAAAMARDLIAARDEPGAPFLVGRLGSPEIAPRAIEAYREAGMHVYSWPEQLVRAARACVDAEEARIRC